MKEFVSYLKQRRRLIGLLALFVGIFGVVFALYRLPLAAVAYGGGAVSGTGASGTAGGTMPGSEGSTGSSAPSEVSRTS